MESLAKFNMVKKSQGLFTTVKKTFAMKKNFQT